MERLTALLGTYWLCVLLLIVAAWIGVRVYRRLQSGADISRPLAGFAIALALLAIGALIPPLLGRLQLLTDATAWAWWLAAAPLAGLFVALLVLILSGRWSAKLACGLAAAACLGLGGAALADIGRESTDLFRVLLRIEFSQPWWLLLLLLVPGIVYLSYRSLAGLGPVRRWLAIGLRSSLVILLALALAEARLRHANENLTVLFLVDRSLSIPEQYDQSAEARATRARIDQRWERIKRFINEAVEKRDLAHDRDKAGIIVFGRRPRLELPPSDAPRFNFDDVASTIDNNYTDIGAAIKLALASFPEGSAKRIVLLSDGNENLGNAEEQARLARQNGVQIDVVPLAVGYKNENEVLVQSVEAPPITEQSSQLPIRVLLRSYNPRAVEGLLTLKQVVNGVGTPVPGAPLRVRLNPGLNSVPFKQSLTKQQQSYTYEAVFHPERVVDGAGEEAQDGLAGDRVQNNRATTHVIALGQRRVLMLEPKVGDHQLLYDHLRRVGDSRFRVDRVTPDDLPQNKAELMGFLSNYDCLIMANVPASDVQPGNVGDVVPGSISDEQQEVIRSNTFDQGCGLVMIGGPLSFGAGGWQGTPVEKALPVDCDIKSLKIQGKGGLVLIMHASEMADGNRWQKEIAKLAIKKLSPAEMMGMIYYAGQHVWHIPFQLVGERRASMLRRVDSMQPGDMPDVDPALEKAYAALTDPSHELATKHIIFISDGDHWMASPAVLAKLRNAKVTCTTVCITSHGIQEEQKMSAVAKATGGKFYSVKTPRALPAIYIKETRLVSQSFTYEKKFQPTMEGVIGGPLEGISAPLPALYGFVRTTAKQNALVSTPIMGPPSGDQEFPVLAYWHYGLGKSVAFTSDALSKTDHKTWDRDWADSQMYEKFWEQVVGWAIRAVETGRFSMTNEYRDGKVKVIVDARDKDNRPITNLTFRGGITTPSAKDAKIDLRFEQKNSGVYETEFKAEEAGSYFIVAQATRKSKIVKDGKEVEVVEGTDSIRSGVTVPYSPEYADMESNVALLDKLRNMTGGKSFADEDEALAAAARGGEAFRHVDLPQSKSLQPIWYWLLLLTAGLLFFDVAVRRIAIDPREAATAGQKVWDHLRRRATTADTAPQYLERLKSRKARVGESLERTKAAQRFEAAEGATVGAPAGADEAVAAAPRPQTLRPPPQVAPDKPEEAADYASRLMKAKKKVWEEREREK